MIIMDLGMDPAARITDTTIGGIDETDTADSIVITTGTTGTDLDTGSVGAVVVSFRI